MLLTSVRAKFIRKIFYTTAIPACAFFIGVVIGQQPYSVTSSHSLANTTVNVAPLEAPIDQRDFPRQNVSLKFYQWPVGPCRFLPKGGFLVSFHLPTLVKPFL